VAQVLGASAERVSAGVVRLRQLLGVRRLGAQLRSAAARTQPLVRSHCLRPGRRTPAVIVRDAEPSRTLAFDYRHGYAQAEYAVN